MKNFNMSILIFSVLFSLLAINLLPSEAYRILGIFPFNSASHFGMYRRLMSKLAARGHRVDVVSHYPLKESLPNYNDIVSLVGSIPDVNNNMTYEFATNALDEESLVITLATEFGGDLCDLMDLPEFRKLINNPPDDPPYDLAIIEIFGSTCYLALGRHLKVPVVGVITSPMWPWANDIVANPESPAYIPHVFSGLYGKLNFWQRLKNTLTMWIAKWKFGHHSAYQNDKIKKFIGPDAPSLKEAETDVALILVNSHYSLHGVRPFTTAVVEVGGLHIKENEAPLQKDLQKWLDDSKDGFVLISFGSMMKIESFPKEMITTIYSSLRKLTPVRVLLKVVNEEELPAGLSSNVLTLPWVPQSAVLRHKNIRAFMTHGGLMGTQEAVYCGVPMIGVPLFADQGQNIELYVRKNIAVSLDHVQLTEESLDNAFNTILHDPSYMESAKRISTEFRDRPMTAAETAVFWVEYVIRHGGRIVRSPALDLTWWQIALLDVYSAIFAAVALAIYLLKVVLSKATNMILGSGVKRASKTKKNT